MYTIKARRKYINKVRHKLELYSKRYLKQKHFPVYEEIPGDLRKLSLSAFQLMFIRNKFLFIGILQCLKEKNLFTAFAILKSYWENTAAIGFYYIKVYNQLNSGDDKGVEDVIKQIIVGGRKFPEGEEEQLKKDHLYLTNVLTMIDQVDKDLDKYGDKFIRLRKIYDYRIAEHGHVTFSSLDLAQNRLTKHSFRPDIKRSWNSADAGIIMSDLDEATKIFFFYWAKVKDLHVAK